MSVPSGANQANPCGTGDTTTGSGQERGPRAGVPHLSHRHQAQLQTVRSQGQHSLGERLQTHDSVSSSPTLARSDFGITKNLGIIVKLV